MNYLKKFIVLLVTTSIILLNSVPVNASGLTYKQINDWWLNKVQQVIDAGFSYQDWLKDVVSMSFDNVGFMVDKTGILIQKIKDAIHGVDSNMSSDMSDQEAYEWVKNNINVTNNSFEFSDSFNSFIKNYHDDYVNEHSPVYGYTFNLQQSTNIDPNFKVKLSGIINDNPNSVVLAYRGNGERYNEIFVFDNVGLYGLRVNASGNSVLIRMYMSYYENEILVVKPFTATSDNFQAYYYNGSDLVEENIAGELSYVGYLSILKDQYTTSGNFNSSPVYFAKSLTGIPVFNTFADMESYINTVGVGLSPYYYNNTVWQDFSSNTGDYTFSPSNINTITYGDTVSYINDYHDTNNNYPDNSTINNWINTTNNNNTSGGGSGGNGGDDSGGGSGSGTDGIFDFLSDLGEVLGNLIKNLGQAITNIIKGISDLVSSIVTDLPTVFFDFIGSIFGWLPEEWVTLLSLSLAAMLIWGIVKVIRG